MTMVNSFPQKMNLSFSGCGFLCIYHAGVAAAIKEYAPHLIANKISGASAGAIVAAGLLCGVCISQATSTILKIVTQARARALGPLHPAFNLLGIVREEIVKTFPPDAFKICTNRLQISLTRWSDNKNIVVDEYASNEELIDAIICSCFIPVYCGVIPPKYRGVAYIDGGFTDNQPAFDDHTVTVSPFSGESDICPPDWDSASFFGISFSKTSIRFTTRNLFRLTACLMPASTEDCSKMCLQGFEDALRFLTKNGMAPCIRCLTLQTNVVGAEDGTVVIPVDDHRGLSPMTRTRKRSSSCAQTAGSHNQSRRLESECDTCCESDHVYNSHIGADVFPSIMRRTFDDAFAAEDSMFKYLLSFRMFRYARTAMGVGKLPWDMLVIFTKNVMSWLSIVTAPDWLTSRINAIVTFVLQEVENQKSRYSRFTCHIALSETPSPQIELSDEARQELAVLRESDRVRRSSESRRAPPVASVQMSRDWSWMEGSDLDSWDHVIQSTQQHEAMYEFHYRDENNRLRSFELFNMSNNARHHNCHSPLGLSPAAVSSPRPVSMVIEEKEEDVAAAAVGDVVRKPEEVDSGLSGVDTAPSSSSRRDACCSPVRHLAAVVAHSSSTSHPKPAATRTKTQTKRHGSFGSNHSNSSRRHHAAAAAAAVAAVRDPVSMSSDSEVDPGERLFVPNRRQRRASSEYDGEPEPSDTDIAS